MEFPDFVLKDENGESLDSSFLKGMRMIVCFVPDLEKDSVDQLCEFDSIYQKVLADKQQAAYKSKVNQLKIMFPISYM